MAPSTERRFTLDFMLEAVPNSSANIFATREIWSLGGMINEIMLVPLLGREKKGGEQGSKATSILTPCSISLHPSPRMLLHCYWGNSPSVGQQWERKENQTKLFFSSSPPEAACLLWGTTLRSKNTCTDQEGMEAAPNRDYLKQCSHTLQGHLRAHSICPQTAGALSNPSAVLTRCFPQINTKKKGTGRIPLSQ